MKNIIFVPETMDLKMKRLALLLGVLALMFSGTGCKPKVHEYWISSDKVTAYKAPSDNAPVIRDLYTFVPVEVVEKDSTGQWGRVRLNYLLFKKSAWLPLSQMTYCGSDNLEEEMETCVVKPETLQLYKSPKANKDNVRSSLQQNDTVQITARDGNWVHVRCLKYSYGKLDEPSSRYGWVAENQLQSIGALTNEVLSEAETEKTNQIIEAQTGQRFSPKMVNVHKIYAKACQWIGWATAAIVLVLLIPAIRRTKGLALLWILLIGALLVFMGTKCVVPSWYFAFMIPLMVYVVCYPLLYIDRTTSLFAILLWVLTLLASGYYLYLYTNIPKHDSIWVYRIIQGVLLLGVCGGIAGILWRRRNEEICSNCGRYADFKTVSEDVLGQSVSYGTETDSSKKGDYLYSKTETVGDKEIKTDYYKAVVYKTEKTHTHTLYTNACAKCGKTTSSKKTYTSTRRLERIQ